MAYDNNTIIGFTGATGGTIYGPNHRESLEGAAIIPVTTRQVLRFLGLPEDTTPENYAAAMDARDRRDSEIRLWMKEAEARGKVACSRLLAAEVAIDTSRGCRGASYSFDASRADRVPESLRDEWASARTAYLSVRREAVLKVREWRAEGEQYGLLPYCFDSRDKEGKEVHFSQRNAEV